MFHSTKIPPHGYIPTFTGDSLGVSGVVSIQAFIRRVEQNTVAPHWSDEQKILVTIKHLAGNAQARLHNRGMHDAVNWSTFKRQIIAAFAVRAEIVKSAYYSYKPDRKKGETIAALVDRVANDLDSYTEAGVMPATQKLDEVQRVLACILPSELHYSLPPIGCLQDLTAELEARAGRVPYLKLTSQDITNERVENKPWSFANEKSTVNAISNPPAAPQATSSATSDNTTVPPNPPPPPPPPAQSYSGRYGGTANKQKCPNESSSSPQDNSTRPRRKDRGRSQQNSQNNQHYRGRNGAKYGNCHTCGKKGHRRQDCRSLNLSCFNCGVQGHLSTVCRKEKKKQPQSREVEFPAPTPISTTENGDGRGRPHTTISEKYSTNGSGRPDAPIGGSWQHCADRSASSRDHPSGIAQPLPTSMGEYGSTHLRTSCSLSSPQENMSIPLNTVSSIQDKYVFSLRICVEIDGNKLMALVDTGSTVSLIEESVVTGNPVINDNITLKTAGKGEGLFSCYKVNQGFEINNKSYKHDFLVVKSLNLPPISLILGYDLISKLKFIIKAQEQTEIILDGNVIPTILANSLTVNIVASEKNRPTFAINVNEITVPPRTALCVNLKLIGKELQEGTQIAVIPCNKFIDILSSDVIVTVDNGFVSMYIYNLTNQPIVYMANQNFARCEPVTITEHIAAVSVCMNREQKLLHLVSLKTSAECFPFMRDIAKLYSSLFVVEDDEPTGFTDLMPFKIDTKEERPVKLKPYRVPVCHQDEVNKQLISMEEQGIISLSKSPWSSPLVVVKKKDGSLRLCVDYRKLNALSVGDSFPLPSIEELLVKVSGSVYFSTVDLKSGYHQIQVDPETRHKTAFCAGDRLYEYNRLPFGLRNAPSHFSRLMAAILANLINSAVLVYLDDLIILGSTPQEHADNLIKVLDTLAKHNLKINLKKCSFFQKSVEFLGHRISKEGVKPLFDKVQAIREFPRPRSPKEVSSFLGLVGLL